MISIFLKHNDETIEYAAQELIRYLDLMAGKKSSAKISKNGERCITLGLYDEFNLSSNVEDPILDDAVYVNVKDSEGIIAGSNTRSVLLAFTGSWRCVDADG